MAEIEKAVSPGARSVLILDGAGWHESGALTIPDDISPLKLPPYIAEHDPVEDFRQFLRRNKLAHRSYDTDGAIMAACCEAWHFLIAAPDRTESIATRDRANAS